MADKTLEQKALAELFGEIALLAFDAVEEARHAPTPHESPDRALRFELQLARTLAQVGWLADMGAKRLGGSYMTEDVGEWFLSPGVRKALADADIAVGSAA